MSKLPSPRALACGSALVLAACGGNSDGLAGGDPGSSAPPASGDFLLGDAAVDDLRSFVATVREVRLRRADGELTPDFLNGETRVEFLGLAGKLRWLAAASYESGEFREIVVGFAPHGYLARSIPGAPLPVQSTSDELVLRFPEPLPIEGGAFDQFLIDLDLERSLFENPDGPGLLFDPEGSVRRAQEPTRVAGLLGLVQSRDTGTGELLVQFYTDQEGREPLVVEEVIVDDATLLVTELNHFVTGVPYYLTFMNPGVTIVRVDGTLLTDGRVLADCVAIETQNGVVGHQIPVKMQGVVTATDSFAVFELAIRDVTRGAVFAGPILDGLEDPFDVRVRTGFRTVFAFANQRVGPQLLTPGIDVEVEFNQFSSEPFNAYRVLLSEVEAPFEGTVLDVGGLPAFVLMLLDPDDPAIADGRLASEQTPVRVDLLTSQVFLSVPGQPVLQPAVLQPTQRIEVFGPLLPPSIAPSIPADRVQVLPGLYDGGVVISASPSDRTLRVGGGTLERSFGIHVTEPPLDVLVQIDATVRGAAHSVEELFLLFEGLQTGQELIVDVAGIGTSEANEVRAFDIVARIDPEPEL